MAPLIASRKRSLADMQHTDAQPQPSEYNDSDYIREVLQLDEGRTESSFDEELTKEAESLGIVIEKLDLTEEKENAHHSMCESAITVASHHARTTSSGSQGSNSTGMTSRSSLDATRKRSTAHRKSLSFGEYEKFLAQAEEDRKQENMGYCPPPIPNEPAPSLFSVSTRRSYVSIRNGIRNRFRLRRRNSSREELNSCICCREDFKKTKSLHILPCTHSYCEPCLRVLISQACTDESKMPPRCCSRAIPGSIIKSVLSREDQTIFMKSVLQFSTPWSLRIFCPNHACGEFIPKRGKIDPKQPFEVVCRKCRTRACSICKNAAHTFGQDCPADWELDAVLQMGEKSGWRRCYKCRNLVELTQGCSHITCRCKAQFCYICGAVWDPVVGCPNYCNGEEELERRRLEEEQRIAEAEKEKSAREEAERLELEEKLAAEKRTAESEELNALRKRQVDERDRFIAFERKQKWLMWTRHGQAKLDVLDKYGELQLKMKERHLRTATHLEDRQVGAEMELRATLKQSERSVQIRLRHMEAYCDGLGRSATGGNPARTVTERDLRQLGEQYNLRDDMERLHQAKINVMREKQGKQMEHLIARQEEEMEKLQGRQQEELEILEEVFGKEEEGFMQIFAERRKKLSRRWEVNEEVERTKLGKAKGVRFAGMEAVEWLDSGEREEGLEVVDE